MHSLLDLEQHPQWWLPLLIDPTKAPYLGGFPQTVYGWRTLYAKIQEAAESPLPFEILAFRHGETWANKDGFVSGTSDVALTCKGEGQAADLGRVVHASRTIIDVAIASPLGRSYRSLKHALQVSPMGEDGLIPVRSLFFDVRVQERGLGDMEGKPSRPVPQWDAGDMRWAPEGGDSYLTVTQRLLSFLVDLHEFLRGWGDVYEGRTPKVLLSTHMGPLRILHGLAVHTTSTKYMLNAHYPNCALSAITFPVLSWPPFLRSYLEIP